MRLAELGYCLSRNTDDLLLSLMLQISESTDIVGITVKCVELFAPLFMSAVETIMHQEGAHAATYGRLLVGAKC